MPNIVAMTTITTPTTDLRAMLDEIDAADASDASEATSLTTEIATMARWLARRAPKAFRQLASKITDKPGHWESSYGPGEHVAARTSERYLLVADAQTTKQSTSSGFYYSYRIVTSEPGLCVCKDGTLVDIIESGSAHLGQYAASPSTDERDIRLDYRVNRSPKLDDLRCAAAYLRRCVAAVRDGVVPAGENDVDVLVCLTYSPAVAVERLTSLAGRLTDQRVRDAATVALQRREVQARKSA